MPALDLWRRDPVGHDRKNGSGGSSPGCISTPDQSMVVPSRRGGGAGLESSQSEAGAFKMTPRAPSPAPRRPRPAGQFLLAEMDQGRAKKVPVVMTTAPAASARPVAEAGCLSPRPLETISSSRLAFDDAEIGRLREPRPAWRRRKVLRSAWGARSAHGRALAAVQHPELDARGIRDPTHQARPGHRPREPDGPLPSPAGSRDCRTSLRWSQKRWVTSAVFRTHPRSRARGLAAGMGRRR